MGELVTAAGTGIRSEELTRAPYTSRTSDADKRTNQGSSHGQGISVHVESRLHAIDGAASQPGGAAGNAFKPIFTRFFRIQRPAALLAHDSTAESAMMPPVRHPEP